ncbi:NAC domain-containing protein 83-like [Syzygium oleosum]|uniref:NAC domain-containing protein 83-like n=1 Tax=Syzygium oleosum TaxID=219896 RepID=UPI0011D25AAE|nr:NAC domain-containing protein 83-like [Syzygium oleosum]
MEMPRFFVSGGGIKLPIGFRFRPTDEELLVHYLKRKVQAVPLPASVIPELDVFGTDPWGLPGNLRERRYFFSRRNRSSSGHECVRVAAGFGYWKYKANSKQISASDGTGNQVTGTRKTLVFCEGRHSTSNVAGTRWILHEFSLAGTRENSKLTTTAHVGDENWAVYRLFQKKLRPRRNGNGNGNLSHPKRKKRSSVIDLQSEAIAGDSLGTPPPSSPCSSSITDNASSCNMLDQEDISSSFL